MQTVTCSERRASLEKGNAEADPLLRRGRKRGHSTFWSNPAEVGGWAVVESMIPVAGWMHIEKIKTIMTAPRRGVNSATASILSNPRMLPNQAQTKRDDNEKSMDWVVPHDVGKE